MCECLWYHVMVTRLYSCLTLCIPRISAGSTEKDIDVLMNELCFWNLVPTKEPLALLNIWYSFQHWTKYNRLFYTWVNAETYLVRVRRYLNTLDQKVVNVTASAAEGSKICKTMTRTDTKPHQAWEGKKKHDPSNYQSIDPCLIGFELSKSPIYNHTLSV